MKKQNEKKTISLSFVYKRVIAFFMHYIIYIFLNIHTLKKSKKNAKTNVVSFICNVSINSILNSFLIY